VKRAPGGERVAGIVTALVVLAGLGCGGGTGPDGPSSDLSLSCGNPKSSPVRVEATLVADEVNSVPGLTVGQRFPMRFDFSARDSFNGCEGTVTYRGLRPDDPPGTDVGARTGKWYGGTGPDGIVFATLYSAAPSPSPYYIIVNFPIDGSTGDWSAQLSGALPPGGLVPAKGRILR